jgi:predicted RNA-binding protein with PIN domain
MPMPFIIDGYNLIHKDPALSEAIDERSPRSARDALVAMLGSFCEHAGRDVTVVFDGGGIDDPALPRIISRGRLEVRYSEPGVTADRLIEAIVGSHPSRGSLKVVSDDEAVRRSARRLGAEAVAAGDFLAILRSALRRSSGSRAGGEKPGFVSDGEVDYWMKQMGLDKIEGAPGIPGQAGKNRG